MLEITWRGNPLSCSCFLLFILFVNYGFDEVKSSLDIKAKHTKFKTNSKSNVNEILPSPQTSFAVFRETGAQTRCKNDQQKTVSKSFAFFKLGNATEFKECLELCCGDTSCDLAVLSGSRCFGLLCDKPKLCRSVLGQLLSKDQTLGGKSTGCSAKGRRRVIRQRTHVSSLSCPNSYVPTYTILLPKTESSRHFRKLHDGPISSDQCKAKCCGLRDCIHAFLVTEHCYGVVCHGDCHAKPRGEKSVTVQIALVDRNEDKEHGQDEDDEDPDELGSEGAIPYPVYRSNVTAPVRPLERKTLADPYPVYWSRVTAPIKPLEHKTLADKYPAYTSRVSVPIKPLNRRILTGPHPVYTSHGTAPVKPLQHETLAYLNPAHISHATVPVKPQQHGALAVQQGWRSNNEVKPKSRENINNVFINGNVSNLGGQRLEERKREETNSPSRVVLMRKRVKGSNQNKGKMLDERKSSKDSQEPSVQNISTKKMEINENISNMELKTSKSETSVINNLHELGSEARSEMKDQNLINSSATVPHKQKGKMLKVLNTTTNVDKTSTASVTGLPSEHITQQLKTEHNQIGSELRTQKQLILSKESKGPLARLVINSTNKSVERKGQLREKQQSSNPSKKDIHKIEIQSSDNFDDLGSDEYDSKAAKLEEIPTIVQQDKTSQKSLRFESTKRRPKEAIRQQQTHEGHEFGKKDTYVSKPTPRVRGIRKSVKQNKTVPANVIYSGQRNSNQLSARIIVSGQNKTQSKTTSTAKQKMQSKSSKNFVKEAIVKTSKDKTQQPHKVNSRMSLKTNLHPMVKPLPVLSRTQPSVDGKILEHKNIQSLDISKKEKITKKLKLKSPKHSITNNSNNQPKTKIALGQANRKVNRTKLPKPSKPKAVAIKHGGKVNLHNNVQRANKMSVLESQPHSNKSLAHKPKMPGSKKAKTSLKSTTASTHKTIVAKQEKSHNSNNKALERKTLYVTKNKTKETLTLIRGTMKQTEQNFSNRKEKKHMLKKNETRSRVSGSIHVTFSEDKKGQHQKQGKKFLSLTKTAQSAFAKDTKSTPKSVHTENVGTITTRDSISNSLGTNSGAIAHPKKTRENVKSKPRNNTAKPVAVDMKIIEENNNRVSAEGSGDTSGTLFGDTRHATQHSELSGDSEETFTGISGNGSGKIAVLAVGKQQTGMSGSNIDAPKVFGSGNGSLVEGSGKVFAGQKPKRFGNVTGVSYRNLHPDVSTAHFYNITKTSEGTKFSASSPKGHHKSTKTKKGDNKKSEHKKGKHTHDTDKFLLKKSGHTNLLDDDMDDLGGADFDILMSNDIPHEDLPKKIKKKKKEKKEKVTKSSKAKKNDKHKDKKKRKKVNNSPSSRHKSHPHVIVGEDASEGDDENSGEDEKKIPKNKHKKHKKKSAADRHSFKGEVKEVKENRDDSGFDNDEASGSGEGDEGEQPQKTRHQQKSIYKHRRHHHAVQKHNKGKDDDDDDNDDSRRTYKKQTHHRNHDEDDDDRKEHVKKHQQEKHHKLNKYHHHDEEEQSRDESHKHKYHKERDREKNENRNDEDSSEDSERKENRRKTHRQHNVEHRKHHNRFDDENESEKREKHKHHYHHKLNRNEVNENRENRYQRRKHKGKHHQGHYRHHNEYENNHHREGKERHNNRFHSDEESNDDDYVRRKEVSRHRAGHRRVFVGEDTQDESSDNESEESQNKRTHKFHSRHHLRFHERGREHKENGDRRKSHERWNFRHREKVSSDQEDENSDKRWHNEQEYERKQLEKEREQFRLEEEKAHKKELEYLKKIRHFEHDKEKQYGDKSSDDEYENNRDHYLGSGNQREKAWKHKERFEHQGRFHEGLRDHKWEKGDWSRREHLHGLQHNNRDWKSEHNPRGHEKEYFDTHDRGWDGWGGENREHQWQRGHRLHGGTASYDNKHEMNKEQGQYYKHNFHGESNTREEHREKLEHGRHGGNSGEENRQDFVENWKHRKPFDYNSKLQYGRYGNERWGSHPWQHKPWDSDEPGPYPSQHPKPLYPTQGAPIKPSWGPQNTPNASPYPRWGDKQEQDRNYDVHSFNNENSWKTGIPNKFPPTQGQNRWSVGPKTNASPFADKNKWPQNAPDTIHSHVNTNPWKPHPGTNTFPPNVGEGALTPNSASNVPPGPGVNTQNNFPPHPAANGWRPGLNQQPTQKSLATRQKIPTGYVSKIPNQNVARDNVLSKPTLGAIRGQANNWIPHNATNPITSTMPGKVPYPRNQSLTKEPPGQSGLLNQNRMPTTHRVLAAPTAGSLTFNKNTNNENNANSNSTIANIMQRLNTPPVFNRQKPGGQIANANSSKRTSLNAPTNNQRKTGILGITKHLENLVTNSVNKSDGSATNQQRLLNSLKGFFNQENETVQSSPGEGPANQIPVPHAESNSKSNHSSKDSKIIPARQSQQVQQQHVTTPSPPHADPRPTLSGAKTTVSAINQIKKAGGLDQFLKGSLMHLIKGFLPYKDKGKNDMANPLDIIPSVNDIGHSESDKEHDEKDRKHRKHRGPTCEASQITQDVKLQQGREAGNFTDIGDVGDFQMCIKRCCQSSSCDLAYKSGETCFLVECLSSESCQTSPSISPQFSPKMCFVKRHSKDESDDSSDNENDKTSPTGIREICDAEKALGIQWTKTSAGHYSKTPCPRGVKGNAKRRCEADSRWLPPDFSDCVSSDYQKLYDKSRALASGSDPRPLLRALARLTTQTIDNSLIFGGDLVKCTEIMEAVVQQTGQNDLLDLKSEDLKHFVEVAGNLLDLTNQQEWYNVQRTKPGSAEVLHALEMFALQAAMRLPKEDMGEPIVTNNIVMKLDRKSAGDEGLSFPDYSYPKLKRWDARQDVIALPRSMFDKGEVSAASINFKTLPFLLPSSNVSSGMGPNSKVISTILHPHPEEAISPPVTIVLSHIKQTNSQPQCVFWDYSINPHRGGGWSSKGCWLAFTNKTHSICQCNHLSNFAVLTNLDSDEISAKEQKRERTMALMWIGIPVLVIGVIGGLYMSFSWTRKSGNSSSLGRLSMDEKTSLLNQKVVTSQVREEYSATPRRDLYRALSPGYSPPGYTPQADLEWQDEFEHGVQYELDDSGYKTKLLPKLRLLQQQLNLEFSEQDNYEAKKTLLVLKTCMKINLKDEAKESNKTELESQPLTHENTHEDPHASTRPPVPPARRNRARVTFADKQPQSANSTDEEQFRRQQRLERRVFCQPIRRWSRQTDLCSN